MFEVHRVNVDDGVERVDCFERKSVHECKFGYVIRVEGVRSRVWEWHGHFMLFDEENGYTPEYICGNYFERLGATKRKMKNDVVKKSSGNDYDDDEKEKEIEKVRNIGLKEQIECGESSSGWILHRNINAGPPRILRN